MEAPRPIGDEKIVYSGRIFEVFRQKMEISGRFVEFESVRRSPGVRIIVIKDGRVLLLRDFRSELRGFDWRLPGGKVFDTLADYKRALSCGKDIMQSAILAAKKECLEETGLVTKNVKHIHTTASGATVVWDLFYFLVDCFEEGDEGQNLEDGEVIHTEWKSLAKSGRCALKMKLEKIALWAFC